MIRYLALIVFYVLAASDDAAVAFSSSKYSASHRMQHRNRHETSDADADVNTPLH